MARNADDLELPTMSVQGMWTPASDREPTDEELLAYAQAAAADREEEPEPAPAPEPVTAPETPVEPGPATELPSTTIQAWTPESGRPPTDEDLLAYAERMAPAGPTYEEPPPHDPTLPHTPDEIAFRQTPGLAPAFPQYEDYVPPTEREGVWRDAQGNVVDAPADVPVLEEGPLGQLREPYQPQLRTLRPVELNPIHVNPESEVGRIRSGIGSFGQSLGSIISGVPKTVALWFAPHSDLGEWMDEMDRIDATDRGAYYEDYDRMERVNHRATGLNRFGTVTNVFTKRIFDLYFETAENTGEELEKNRALARAMYIRELASTVETPMYRAGEVFDETVAEMLPTNPEYAEEFWNGKIPAGLGSVVGYMATFAATRRLPGGKVSAPLTTAGTGITVQQAFAFQNALEAGADIETAFEAAFSGETMLAGGSEAIPIFGFFNRADKASGGVIKQALIRMMKQGTEEAIQEGFQTIMENMVAQRLYDPERQLWGGTGEAGTVGFTTGAIVEGIATLLIPGRRQGGQAPPPGGDLETQIENARQAAAAEGGDALDQAVAGSEAQLTLAEAEAQWQEGLKERLRARQEAREAQPDQRPLAALVEAESDLARMPFEARAETVMGAAAEQIAEDKAAAFERAEAEAAQQREAEVQEAEFQQEVQKGEAAAETAEALEAAEEVQADVEPATIGETIDEETREGLRRMQSARAGKETTTDVESATVPEPVAALPAPALKVTPEGEVLDAWEARERQEAQDRATRKRILAKRREREARGLPAIERPFAVEEEVEVEAETQRATELTEQLDLPVNEVTQEAQAAATSPTNQLQQPTDAQKEAGNYKKGHLGPNQVAIPGINIAVENPAGSVRSGTREDGTRWTQNMRDHYGYINRTESAEGPEEQLDVFVNPEIMEQQYDTVFVIDQVNEDGNFDEHKVMIGYPNQMAAVRAYKRNYPRGQQVGPVTPMSKVGFRRWLQQGDQTQPVQPEGAPPQVLTGEEEFRALEKRQRRKTRREPTVRFRAGEEVPTAGFYSRMREAVEAKMPANLPVDRVQQFIERQAQRGAFRAEEAAFYDIAQFLEGREGTVSKQEILDYLDFRRPDIEIQMLESISERQFPTNADAMAHLADVYGPLQDMRPGSGSVRDANGVLVAFISRPEGSTATFVTYKVKHEVEPVYADHQAIPNGTNYREMLIKLPAKPGRFQSRFTHRHWPGQKNVLAHVRMADFVNDRGERTLVVLEVQSDWHQIGRKEGYKSPEERLKREGANYLASSTEQWLDDVLGQPEDAMVEEAPFKKSWPLMAMRQVLDYAVKQGYDNVAWSTGEQQADLYGEINRVDELVYRPEFESLEVMSDGRFLEVEGGREEIEAVVGKEITDQLMEAAEARQEIRDQYSIEEEYNEEEGGYLVVGPDGEYVRDWAGGLLMFDSADAAINDVFLHNDKLPGNEPVVLKGVDLKFGGEGMMAFYDRELVNVMNKWVKRFDTTVQDGRVASGKEYKPVHEVSLTPELQTGVATVGQPFFRAEEEVEAEKQDRVELKDAKKIVQPLIEQMKRIRPKILANPLQAPEELREIMEERGAMNAKGVFYNGTLYIFAENHTEPRDVVRTLLHEGVAHMGLRALYTNEAELDAFLDEVYESMSIEEVREMQGKSRVYAAIDLDTEAGRREMAEEFIAEKAESDPQNNFVQRLVAWLRQILRYAGMEIEWSNNDIVSVLADARRELREFVPTNRMEVTLEVEDAATGEIVEVAERADIALRQNEKRQGVIESLRECIG